VDIDEYFPMRWEKAELRVLLGFLKIISQKHQKLSQRFDKTAAHIDTA
jgi:hypothetical protein